MKKSLLQLASFVVLLLFILAASVAFTINFRPLYSFDIDYLGIEQMTGLSKETLLANYAVLLDYLNLPWIRELNMPDFPASASGLFHFYEVKKLFLLDYAILAVTAVLLVGLYFYLKKRNSWWQLLRPLQILLVLPFVLLALIFMNFDRLFVLFHQVFFNNDAWIFDASTDPVILALPEDFFMHCFILAFVVFELLSLVFYFFIKRKVYSTSKKR